MHQADQGLPRREAADHFLAERACAHRLDEVLHHRQCDVGLKQRDAHFAQALSVMMWLAVLICWVEGLFYRIELVYPMALAAAALCAPLPAFFSGRASPDPVSFEFRLHLFFGMLAYSLFVVATFHALLISSV